VTVEVLAEDARRYLARTNIEGTLDPTKAPELPLAGLTENGPEWRGGEFAGPLTSGESRWYRMELMRGEVMNVFALFPGDRFVGEGTEGEFSIVLTDLDGDTVGRAFESTPQMGQTFGDERHQATVSGTTSYDDDPLPETVMIGFQWSGPQGQESEIRFEVEAMFDPQRKEMAEQIEANATDDGVEQSVPSTTSPSPATTVVDASGPTDGASFPLVAFLVAGVFVIGVGVVAFGVRRSRTG
jgi:hypothetical protein